MEKIRRFLALFLALAMVLALAACGEKGGGSQVGDEPAKGGSEDGGKDQEPGDEKPEEEPWEPQHQDLRDQPLVLREASYGGNSENTYYYGYNSWGEQMFYLSEQPDASGRYTVSVVLMLLARNGHREQYVGTTEDATVFCSDGNGVTRVLHFYSIKDPEAYKEEIIYRNVREGDAIVSYDQAGRVARRVTWEDGVRVTEQMDHNEDGSLSSRSVTRDDGAGHSLSNEQYRTDENGNEFLYSSSEYQYDEGGRLLRSANAYPQDNRNDVTEYTYDEWGNRLTRTTTNTTAAGVSVIRWVYEFTVDERGVPGTVTTTYTAENADGSTTTSTTQKISDVVFLEDAEREMPPEGWALTRDMVGWWTRDAGGRTEILGIGLGVCLVRGYVDEEYDFIRIEEVGFYELEDDSTMSIDFYVNGGDMDRGDYSKDDVPVSVSGDELTLDGETWQRLW